MSESGRGTLSRRDLLKRAAAGAAAYAASGVLAGASQPISAGAGQRSDAPADLLLADGKFVDGRGLVGTALTIKNSRIVKVGLRHEVGAAARTIDLQGVALSFRVCSMRTCTTCARASIQVSKRVESSEPSRSPNCRSRLRSAPNRCPLERSSHVSVAGTTRSWPNDDRRRRRISTRRRPNMRSTFLGRAEEPAPLRTVLAGRSLLVRASWSTRKPVLSRQSPQPSLLCKPREQRTTNCAQQPT